MSVLRNTVWLKGDFLHKEGRAATATIYPGMAVMVNSAGKVAIDSTAITLAVVKRIVREDDMHGQGLDVNYLVDQQVVYGIPQPGGEVNVRIAAGASAIVIGDNIVKQTTGLFAKSTLATDFVYGVATEAIDNSGGGSAVYLSIEVT